MLCNLSPGFVPDSFANKLCHCFVDLDCQLCVFFDCIETSKILIKLDPYSAREVIIISYRAIPLRYSQRVVELLLNHADLGESWDSIIFIEQVHLLGQHHDVGQDSNLLGKTDDVAVHEPLAECIVPLLCLLVQFPDSLEGLFTLSQS